MFIRLTALLCAGLYGSMTILGTEQPGTTSAIAATPDPISPVFTRGTLSPATAPLVVPASFSPMPKPVATPTPAAGPVLPPSKFEAETPDRDLLRIGTFDAPANVLQDKGIDVVEVTGTVVNLRAGPSTGNDVVTKLRQGSRAELIDTAANGWMRIRDLDSGAEGYMSGDFLQQITPS